MKIILTSLSLVLLTSCLYSQPSFSLLINSPNRELAVGGIIEFSPSRYILSGTQSIALGQKVWQKFYKIDGEGDTIQSLVIEKDTSCMFFELYQINEKDILCFGAILNRLKPAEIWLTCIDTSLNLLWEKSIQTPIDQIYTIKASENHDSTLIIAAGLEVDFYTRYILMLRINQDGDSLYSKYIGPNTAYIFDLMRTPKTNQLLMPVLGLSQQTNTPGQIIIFNSSFNICQVDSIPNYVGNCCTVKSLNDTAYFLAGNKYYAFSNESYNIALMKMIFPNLEINSAIVGRSADTMDFAGTFQGMDFINPSNIYIAGTSNISFGGYYAYQPSWYLISRFDSTLNLYWTKYYGGDAYYVLQSVTATSDGGAIVAGTRFDYLNHPENQLDVYVLKIDSTGLYTNVDKEEPVPVYDAIVYPNPGSDYLIVQSGPQVSGAVFRMYDMLGRQVMEERLTSTLLRFNAGSLAAGTYPWQIIFNNKTIENGKWVKE